MKHILTILILGISCVSLAADLVVTSPATKSSGMKIKSSGVPTYNFNPKVATPRLRIGKERSVQAQVSDLSALPAPPVTTFQGVKKAQPLSSIKRTKLAPVTKLKPAKVFVSEKTIAKVPDVKELSEVPEPTFKDSNPTIKDLYKFTANDFKLIEGLIFLQIHGNNDMALPILSEIFKDKSLKHEAMFHYAEAARKLGLPKEFRNSLLTVAREASDQGLRKAAAAELTKHIRILDVMDIKDIEPLTQKYDVDISVNDAYNFYRAKYYLEEGNLGQVEDALALIPEKSEYHGDALFISALYNYRRGQINKGQQDLEQVLKKIAKDNPIRTVAALTLARIHFQKNNFKEAFTTYLEVDKSHPLWLQAMVEQAWTQILFKDFEGAAGNMFPLHTDFFKNAYNAESYVVRTVAYLNLCQFGDAQNVLQNLGRKYAPIYGKLLTYKDRNKNKSAPYYDTVRGWLKSPNLKEVDGLPRSFIVEWARHPSYVNIQKNINTYEDEISNFNKVTLNLIQREKDVLAEQVKTSKSLSDTRIKLTDSKTPNKDLLKQEEVRLNRKLSALKYESSNINRARNQVKVIRDIANVKLEAEKKSLRAVAANTLRKRFDMMIKDLKNLIDQNEVLQYEIYAGAGEHIRYQTAGGEVSKETRDELKVDKAKAMKWSFKGEIWEDEIGHFRSSLKSVCPPDDNG